MPALVELGSSNHLLTRFPTNPFSSQSQGEASEGLVALWLVEGLCQEGNFGGLNPLLVEHGKPLDATLESQLRLQAEAQVAYRRWWSLTRGMDRLDAMALDPLEDTGLAWYGSVRR